jgi:hypothetical protein
MKGLRAFTLLELLFVMILTTIIIGIGYLTFNISTRQLHSYRANSKKISGVFLVTMLLNKDFTEAKSVLKANDSLIFTSDVNSLLQYFFTEDYIVRNANSVTDTFYYKTQNRSEKFLDKPADVNRGLVDEIYFEIKTDDERAEVFHAMKAYSAEALMLQEEKDKVFLP